MDMFEQRAEKQKEKEAPLATRMRPSDFHAFVGQEHLIGTGRALRKLIQAGQIPSMILWGPPGSGKTTLAYLIANNTNSYFSPISAVSAGVADLRRIITEAKERRRMQGQKTILFIDEIHRFNKAQQDAILPFVEDGTLILIGATTENPSFEVISPLLSRCQTFTLKPLTENELRLIILRALRDGLRGLGSFNLEIDDDALNHLIVMSNSDARSALNNLEMAAMATQVDEEGKRHIALDSIEDTIQHKALPYDKNGEEHYDVISALHKSMRDSDPDASLYWLARMLEAGEDPLYVARRIVRFASEDVGMADPQALLIAMAAQQAVRFIGMPEGNLALAEAAVYLAVAPKSNSLYEAYNRIQEELKSGTNEPVPLNIRNPVTPLMKATGYGEGYKYAHDYPEHTVTQQHLPESVAGKRFYTPSDQGHEKEIQNWLEKYHQQQKKLEENTEGSQD